MRMQSPKPAQSQFCLQSEHFRHSARLKSSVKQRKKIPKFSSDVTAKGKKDDNMCWVTRVKVPQALLLLGIVIGLVPNLLRVKALHTEEGLELLFHQRTQSDWEDVWHSETHSRCRDKLVRQLYWACEKDIYRLSRRNRKRVVVDSEDLHKQPFLDNNIWLPNNVAIEMLRTRRSGTPSITNECCTKNGCTWEEYAEYCPSNKRRNHY